MACNCRAPSLLRLEWVEHYWRAYWGERYWSFSSWSRENKHKTSDEAGEIINKNGCCLCGRWVKRFKRAEMTKDFNGKCTEKRNLLFMFSKREKRKTKHRGKCKMSRNFDKTQSTHIIVAHSIFFFFSFRHFYCRMPNSSRQKSLIPTEEISVAKNLTYTSPCRKKQNKMELCLITEFQKDQI